MSKLNGVILILIGFFVGAVLGIFLDKNATKNEVVNTFKEVEYSEEMISTFVLDYTTNNDTAEVSREKVISGENALFGIIVAEQIECLQSISQINQDMIGPDGFLNLSSVAAVKILLLIYEAKQYAIYYRSITNAGIGAIKFLPVIYLGNNTLPENTVIAEVIFSNNSKGVIKTIKIPRRWLYAPGLKVEPLPVNTTSNPANFS